MKLRYLFFTASVLIALALLGMVAPLVSAGGWAVISLENLPEGVQPGQPFTVRFTVLQHGISPMTDIEPTIQAFHAASGTQLSFEAQPTAKAGVYEASLTLPEAGDWEWSIAAFTVVQPMPALTVEINGSVPTVSEGQSVLTSTGNGEMAAPAVSLAAGLVAAALFGAALWLQRTSTAQMAPVLMVDAILLMVFAGVGATRTYATEPQTAGQVQIKPTVDNGDALFTSKGCVTCHTHSLVSVPAGFPINSGPNLTRVSLGTDYLRLWLKNPQAVKPNTDMPNLHLTEGEIEALIAFLIRE